MGLAIKKDRRYTYQDYRGWPDEERWEIIDGAGYNMSPAPKVKHQMIVGQLLIKLADGAEAKGCSLFIAPTDVVLDEYNIIQPDVFVVCYKKKITSDNIQGAPDLIIEVISPSTELKDRREKKGLYERFGVREYIIVSPEGEFAERYCLKEGGYGVPVMFNWDEIMKLESFDIELNLWEIFEKERSAEGV